MTFLGIGSKKGKAKQKKDGYGLQEDMETDEARPLQLLSTQEHDTAAGEDHAERSLQDGETRASSSLEMQLPEDRFRVSRLMPGLQSRFSLLQEKDRAEQFKRSSERSMARYDGPTTATQPAACPPDDASIIYGSRDASEDSALVPSRSKSRLAFESIPEEPERPRNASLAELEARLQEVDARLAATRRSLQQVEQGLRPRSIPSIVVRQRMTLPADLHTAISVPTFAQRSLPPIPRRTDRWTMPVSKTKSERPATFSSATSSSPRSTRGSLPALTQVIQSGVRAAYGPRPTLRSGSRAKPVAAVAADAADIISVTESVVWPMPPTQHSPQVRPSARTEHLLYGSHDTSSSDAVDVRARI